MSDDESFEMDLLSNRSSYTNEREAFEVTYSENNLANEYDQIDWSTPAAVSYDANGNLTENEHGYGFVYDHDNHLIEVTDPDGATLATYAYDALGRRIAETKGGKTTHFYYDGQRVIAEFDSDPPPDGTLARYFVDGAVYVDEHLLMNDNCEDFYYVHGSLHTVLGLADKDGNLVEAYQYDAYGRLDETAFFEPPATASEEPGCRYLAVTPPPGTEPIALLVTPLCEGGEPKYVGPPRSEDTPRNRAMLVDNPNPKPLFMTPDEWLDDGQFTSVYVTGPDLAPSKPGEPQTYAVEVDHGSADCSLLSTPIEIETALWGDVAGIVQDNQWTPPDGDADVQDMTACVDAFKQYPWAPPFHWANVMPYICDTPSDWWSGPLVSIMDCLAVIDAFKDIPYDGYPNTCPRPCDPSEPEQLQWRPKNPYYFTGRRLDFNVTDGTTGDPELTLYHYRARAYDPTHARFLQRDPAGYVDGMNLYEYVGSRPVAGVDPFGRQHLMFYGAAGEAMVANARAVRSATTSVLNRIASDYSRRTFYSVIGLDTAVSRLRTTVGGISWFSNNVSDPNATAEYLPESNVLHIAQNPSRALVFHELIHANNRRIGRFWHAPRPDEGTAYAGEHILSFELPHLERLERSLDEIPPVAQDSAEVLERRWQWVWTAAMTNVLNGGGDYFYTASGRLLDREIPVPFRVNAQDLRNLRTSTGLSLSCPKLAAAYNKRIEGLVSSCKLCVQFVCRRDAPTRHGLRALAPNEDIHAVFRE